METETWYASAAESFYKIHCALHDMQIVSVDIEGEAVGLTIDEGGSRYCHWNGVTFITDPPNSRRPPQTIAMKPGFAWAYITNSGI